MARNHPRLNQTSMDVLQSWRGNCDVQILIYDCDTKNPDVSEIARVTDYVVSYACKGNTTTQEEKEHTKQLIMRCVPASALTALPRHPMHVASHTPFAPSPPAQVRGDN